MPTIPSFLIYLQAIPTTGLFFPQCQRPEYRLSSDKSCNPDKENPWQNTDAVYHHITDRGSPSRHKRLVIFIQSCEGNAECSRQKYKPETSDSVYIQRKRHCDGKYKIFCHMSCLTYIIVDLLRISLYLCITPVLSSILSAIVTAL